MKNINWSGFRKICVVMVGVWSLVLVAGLVMMATFARPIADEYYFISEVRDKGILGYTGYQYLHWGGRLVQSLGSGIAYKVFGDIGAQIVMPMIFLGFFGTAWSWLIYQVAKFHRHQFVLSVASGFLLAGAIMYSTVCLFDIYLWMDSAIVHFMGMIMVVYDVALFVWLMRNRGNLKTKKWLVIMLLAVAFVGQTASETSMLLTMGWSFLALVSTCVVKRWHDYRGVAALCFVVLLIGGLVMIVSPGLWVRAGSASESSDFLHMVVMNPVKAIVRVFAEMGVWKVTLMILVAILVGTLTKNINVKKNWKIMLLSVAMIFVSLVYFPLVVYYFGSHASGAEARILAMPSMGVFVCGVVILSFMYEYLIEIIRKRKNERTITVVVFMVALVAAILSGKGIYQFNKGYLAALSVRAAALDVRETEINRYKKGLIDELVVADLPVMIQNSDATDFTANNYTTPEWFYNGFLSMYDISEGSLKVVGGKLLNEVVPEWYEEREMQICTIVNTIVYPKYYCVNRYYSEQ